MSPSLVLVIVTLVGALVWAMTGGKAAEAGRIVFICGTFWLLYTLSAGRLHL